jgi:hypothetical protein
MKKLLLLVVLFLPFSVFARNAISTDTYIVSEAGISAYNGNYTYIGDCYSQPMFGNGYAHLAWLTGSGYDKWLLATDATCNAGTLNYKQGTPPADYDPTTEASAWVVHEGASPAPTIILSGGEETASTTASTTGIFISNLADISFGIAILIGLSSLGLIGFAFNTLNKRKKVWQS